MISWAFLVKVDIDIDIDHPYLGFFHLHDAWLGFMQSRNLPCEIGP